MSSDHPTFPTRLSVELVKAGYAEGASDTERRIVEWLRGLDGKRDFGRPSNVADAIERSEHRG